METLVPRQLGCPLPHVRAGLTVGTLNPTARGAKRRVPAFQKHTLMRSPHEDTASQRRGDTRPCLPSTPPPSPHADGAVRDAPRRGAPSRPSRPAAGRWQPRSPGTEALTDVGVAERVLRVDGDASARLRHQVPQAPAAQEHGEEAEPRRHAACPGVRFELQPLFCSPNSSLACSLLARSLLTPPLSRPQQRSPRSAARSKPE